MQNESDLEGDFPKQGEVYLKGPEELEVEFNKMKEQFGDLYGRAFSIFQHYLQHAKKYAWSVIEVFDHALENDCPPEVIEDIIVCFEKYWESDLKQSSSPSDASIRRMFSDLYHDKLHRKPIVNTD